MSQDTLNIAALVWGVKQSFRDYVEGSGGKIETHGGAGRSEDGAFVFTPSPGGALTLDASGAPQGCIAFSGEITFQAHGGMLSVRLLDPAVEITPESAVLTAAEGGKSDQRYPIATLDLAALTRGEAGEIIIPTKLTRDGAYLLGDHYPAMTPVDPVRLTLAD